MNDKQKLEEAEKEILLLKDELERIQQPPYMTGTVLDSGTKTTHIAIDHQGIYEIAKVPEKFEKTSITRGSRVILNPKTSAVMGISEFPTPTGQVVSVEEIQDGRLKVIKDGKPHIVYNSMNGTVKVGDEVLLDEGGYIALQRFDKKKTKYMLEEVEKAPWNTIGGLEDVISVIKEEIEYPITHSKIYERYGKKPAKGILLFGPPGCGKTKLAKSIAYNLGVLANNGNAHFISVKGPEILDKYVGNSELNIRNIYAAARENSRETKAPTVVFVDEAEAIAKKRGTGISTDVYDSIVPQWLSEIDGMSTTDNVITILATNREDILDPAILRDGRVDRKIRIPRPNKKGCNEIFDIYFKNKPLQGAFTSVRDFISPILDEIFSDDSMAYRVMSSDGQCLGKFGYKNLISGAMIEGMVARACGYAIKREIANGKKGICKDDLYSAFKDELNETTQMTQTLVKDDWKDVFGEKASQYEEMFRHGYINLQRNVN